MPPQARRAAGAAREDRLKAALKANMARRKAQAGAREARPAGDSGNKDKDDEAGMDSILVKGNGR
jgi:hypothetical protein